VVDQASRAVFFVLTAHRFCDPICIQRQSSAGLKLYGPRNRLTAIRLILFRHRFLRTTTVREGPVTTIAMECDGEPKQDTNHVRKDRPRLQA
jgi:hypothetical protein